MKLAFCVQESLVLIYQFVFSLLRVLCRMHHSNIQHNKILFQFFPGRSMTIILLHPDVHIVLSIQQFSFFS